MEWTEEAISRLRALWDEGHSTAEIGRRMGISKNAVVGKAHRLQLPPRPSPIRREGHTPRAPRRSAPRRVSGPTLPSLAGPSPDSGTFADPAVRPERRALPVAGSGAALAMSRPERPERVEAAPSIAAELQPRPPEPRPTVRPVAVNRSSSRQIACCWPIGEPGTRAFRFCDGEALAGKPYCSEHAALAYVKVRDRREEAA